MNSIVANLQRYEWRMVYGLIIFYSLFSLLSLHFIIFSSLSHLFSLTNSLSPIPSFLFKFVEIFFLLQFKISLTVAIITKGASEKGDKFAAHGARVIVIPHWSRRSLSLSLFWWLVVLIVVGWLRFVDRRWCGLRCGFWVAVMGVRFGMGEGWWRLLQMI